MAPASFDRVLRGLVIAMVTVGWLAGAQTAAAAAPVVTITAGPAPNALTNDNTPTFAFTADQAGVGFSCVVDVIEGATPSACASPHTVGPLPDGGHSLTVYATNGAGEVGSAQRVIVVDATPPETTITEGPADGAVINDDAPTFAWASSEVGSTFTCVTDGVTLESCDLVFVLGVASGPHTLTVTATDPAGNVDPTPATRTFTVSLTGAPPDLPRCQVDGRVVIGTSNDDTRIGTPGTDVMFGRAGDDLLRGVGGGDCLAGEAGDDRLFGGSGNDFAFGNAGADRIAGDAGNDELFGDAGSDRITGGAGLDMLDGGTGADHLSDATGRDTFSGGAGNDRIDARDRSLYGRRTPDKVRCGAGRFDVALVDRRDNVGRDCERVSRRR